MYNNLPEIFSNVGTKWFYKAPFLSEILFRISFKEDENIPTIGITLKDKRYLAIIFNPLFIAKLNKEQIEGVLLHEIMHLLNLTEYRGKGKNNKLWNIATDITINEEILNEFTIAGTSLQLPKEGVFLSQIQKEGYNDKVIAENIYSFLVQNNKGQDMDTMDDHSMLDDLSEEEKAELKFKIKQIKEFAKNREYGSISGSLKTKLKQLVEPTRIPLNKLLRKYIQTFISGNKFKRNNWSKANRRNIQYLPGKKKYSTKLNVVVDTSGSCFSEDILQIFFSEIEFIAKTVSHINIIEFDTEIKQTYKYTRNDWRKINFKGGGGTEIQPVFDYLKTNKLLKEPVIIFTDGYMDLNINLYNCTPLWVLTQDIETHPTIKNKIILKEG
jgi:predicted metal-dependent peptidase